MSERREIFLWTADNTFVKGWIQTHKSGLRRVDINYEVHPYLKENLNFKINPHILETYAYYYRKTYPSPQAPIPVQN